MKKKKLPNQKQKGIYIYCCNSQCRKYFSWTNKNIKNDDETFSKTEPLCGISKKKLSSCKHHDKHKYIVRLHIPGSNDRKISKTLNAETYQEALVQAVEYENEFKHSIKYSDSIERPSKRHYLFDTQIKYMDFLENVNVPEHKKVQRSEKHIKDIIKT